MKKGKIFSLLHITIFVLQKNFSLLQKKLLFLQKFFFFLHIGRRFALIAFMRKRCSRLKDFFACCPKEPSSFAIFFRLFFSDSLGSMRQCFQMAWKVNRAASFGAALSVKRGMITS